MEIPNTVNSLTQSSSRCALQSLIMKKTLRSLAESGCVPTDKSIETSAEGMRAALVKGIAARLLKTLVKLISPKNKKVTGVAPRHAPIEERKKEGILTCSLIKLVRDIP